jgi:O-antigen/teichoic acid export membrane protein
MKIKTTTSAYQLYQILRLVVLVLISIALVKLSFSREETSVFELFLFVINISTFFWVIGIGNSILSYYSGLNTKEKESFFQNIFFLLQFAGLIIAILLYFTNGLGLVKNEDILSIGGTKLIAFYLFFYSPTLLIEIKYIIKKEKEKLLKYGIVIFLLQLVLIIAVAAITNSIFQVLIAMTFWIFIRWIWTISTVFKPFGRFTLSKILLKGFVLFSLPIIAHILLGNGMEYIDGLIVNSSFKPDLFSVYRYGAREFPVILILIGALRSTMIPDAIENIENALENIKKETRKIIIVFFPVAILLMLSSKFLYTFFYSEEYTYSALLFNIYLLIISSRIILAEVFIYANKMNKLFMKVSFWELVANIVLSLIFLRFWGIAGIAFATFIAFLGSKLFLVFIVHSKYDIPLNKYLDLKLYFPMTILLYLSFIISLFVFF